MKNILCLGLMLLPLAACTAAPHHNTSSADGDHSNHVTPSLCLLDQAKKLVGKAGLSDAQIMQKTMLLRQPWGPGELNVHRAGLQQTQGGPQGLHRALASEAAAHTARIVGTAGLERGRCHDDLLIYVYVNVNYESFLVFDLEQQSTRLCLVLLNLIQIGLQVSHLLFQLLAVLHQHIEEFAQLDPSVSGAVVQVNDLPGLCQRQAQPLCPERQAQPSAVTGAVNAISPCGTHPFWLQKTHVFVEADRPGGEVKLFGKVADGVGGGHGGYCALLDRFHEGDSSAALHLYNAPGI